MLERTMLTEWNYVFIGILIDFTHPALVGPALRDVFTWLFFA